MATIAHHRTSIVTRTLLAAAVIYGLLGLIVAPVLGVGLGLRIWHALPRWITGPIAALALTAGATVFLHTQEE